MSSPDRPGMYTSRIMHVGIRTRAAVRNDAPSAEEARQYAISDFTREILAVADNLQRTIAAAGRHPPESAEDAALIEGVQATDRILQHTLERFAIRKIDALGQRFDPTLHEAVIETDDDTQPPGTVVRVVEDGYTIHGRDRKSVV